MDETNSKAKLQTVLSACPAQAMRRLDIIGYSLFLQQHGTQPEQKESKEETKKDAGPNGGKGRRNLGYFARQHSIPNDTLQEPCS
jgi:hypothetical protein